MTEETPTSQVPLLDLAPKLKRPLSLWNPLDYLLLLYWVFYFPQAIPWYVETFCEPPPDLVPSTWQQVWALIKTSQRKRQLSIMGLFLSIFFPVVFSAYLERIGIKVNWEIRGVSSVIFSLILFLGIFIFEIIQTSQSSSTKEIGKSLPIATIISITVGVAMGVNYGVKIGIEDEVTLNIGQSVILGFVNGFAGGIVGSSFFALFRGITIDLVTPAIGFGIISLVGGILGYLIQPVTYAIASYFFKDTKIVDTTPSILNFVVFAITTSMVILRPDDLCLSLGRKVPRITHLNLTQISRQLNILLAKDWRNGLISANQILKYSCQFIAVNVAINQSLAVTHSDVLLERIAALSDEILDWHILCYASASLEISDRISSEDVDEETEDEQNYLRLDTYAHAAAAAFWYLHIENISRSITVFENLRHIENGEEMYQIACFLLDISKVKNIKDIHNLKKPTFSRLKILRAATWSLLKKITLVIEDVHIVCFAKSRVAKSFALNRALGQISEVLNEIESLPDNISRVERPIIHKITNQWKELLVAESRKIGNIEIDKPISSPYIIGDPVFGNNFIGREDILSQLESLWIVNALPQSIILYGHRRMGKTSILRNIPTNLGYQVRVAYVNLLSIGGAPNGITDILMAICDAIQEATNIPTPDNNDLFQFPESTFRRYLQHIEKTFTGKGLIIALDEFEKIEELIDAGKLSKDFLGFLRGMVQMSSKLAFAFAGLHTLQEMNADYFQPFYASFIPISVAFLTREATHQVLANPDPEFLLEYEPATLDHIYDLTNGQPYLTQLIGFQLVRLFNDYVFEQGKPRDRTFTIDDVRTICSGENFFTTGINYFNGVWQQASEGATHQQDILKALAPHPQGLTESELISQTNLPSETLHDALKTLKDHDVIRSQKTDEIVNYAIAVELFRTWVVKYKLSNT
jgi:hypothetical protein